MANSEVNRKLAAILAADVVGYSRLMGKDETGTLNRLKAIRREIVQPKVSELNGRVVKVMGDGLLAEFPSVIDAVQCAINIQNSLVVREAETAEESRIMLRIGVNLGDILIEGSDIYGDGVNVAARLEGLAEPGGICVSKTVFDHVKGKLDAEFTDCGEHQLKNISEPLRVFRVGPQASVGITPDVDSLEQSGNAEGVGVDSDAISVDLSIPEICSIAVLPFENMSNDPEQEFFSDGITEDIITALSKINDLLVVARNSTFVYKGQAVDVKKVSRELGVRYVLEGSVRSASGRVRITAQLIDASTGLHIWAERYDRKLQDIFAVQDEITREVVVVLDVKLRGGEQASIWASGTQSLEAWECVRRGMDVLNSVTIESPKEAEILFKRALEIDPNYSMAWVGLGWSYHHSVELKTHHIDRKTWESAHVKAIDCGERALQLDPSCGDAYSLLALNHLSREDYDTALDMAEKSITLAPSHAEILGIGAMIQNKLGDPDRGLILIKKAMRCCPNYPSWFLQVLGTSYRLTGQLNASIATFKAAIARTQDYVSLHVNLASALGEAERMDEAKKTVSEILRINPGFSVEEYVSGVSYKDPVQLKRLEDSLRKVGLPD